MSGHSFSEAGWKLSFPDASLAVGQLEEGAPEQWPEETRPVNRLGYVETIMPAVPEVEAK